MKLDSVRELKATLLKKGFGMPMSPQVVSAYGMPARRLKEVEQAVLPTLAIGVSPVKQNDYKVAVRIQRRGMEGSPHLDALQTAARGEVDVRYIGRVTKRSAWNRDRHRPLMIGTSIGHYEVTAGTLGCFVRTKRDGMRILSNNHVLADENRASAGDAILQPGRYDGGTGKGDTIGSLDAFVQLKTRGSNVIDCALSTVDDGVDFETKLHRSGSLGALQPNDGTVDNVEKIGRTTGHTHGRVTAFELDNVVVGYDIGNIKFDNQIEVEGARTAAFSDGGDSGSLIFTSGDRLAFALLFAGSDHGGSNGRGQTYANPIEEVLSGLKVELLL